MKKTNKISIILFCLFLLLLSLYFLQDLRSPSFTMSHLALKSLASVDEIHVKSSTGDLRFRHDVASGWQMFAPYACGVDADHFKKVSAVLASGIHLDLEEEDPSVWGKLGFSNNSTVVSFISQGILVEKFSLGDSLRMEGSNAERVWILPEGSKAAFRAFVPLYDLGKIFQAPPSRWRDRVVKRVDEREIESIRIRTGIEVIEIGQALDSVTDRNPRGWVIEGSGFEVDATAVATIGSLVSPLYVDGFADDVSWSDALGGFEGAQLEIRTGSALTTVYVGQTVTEHNCPQCTTGDGARFVKIDDDPQVYTMESERLIALLPTLNRLRSKHVLEVDPERLTEILVQTQTSDVAIKPDANKKWNVHLENSFYEPDPKRLGLFVKWITHVEATRFLEETEVLPSSSPVLTITLKESEVSHRILLYEIPNQKVPFVYATIDDCKPFVLSDRMVQAFGALLLKE